MSDMLAELRTITQVTEKMAGDIHDMKQDITELKTQQAKIHITLGELRLSTMKLAERSEEIVQLDQRVRVLENIVLPKAS